ncbi:helix-turn-helix domain-containing protein [Rhodococcus hoagii]|nr:helix-turn-helix domain-containing protein [Prescottella equi]
MPAEDADRMIVELPLGVVGLTADQIGEVSGVDLRERTSLAALLQSVLGGVMDSELSLRDEVDVFAPVADLLKVTLLSALTPDRATTRYPLAEQIVTYVLDNLTDPGLGAARIAKDLHVSERLLYAEMSRADIRLAQLIQSQRLRRVRDALTAPATIDVPIGVLAQQHGFVSASHFSRIFREEFGTHTPPMAQQHHTARSVRSPLVRQVAAAGFPRDQVTGRGVVGTDRWAVSSTSSMSLSGMTTAPDESQKMYWPG